MGKNTRYKLTYRSYRTLKGRGFELKCRRCGKPLQINDMVESKQTKYKSKFFHAECYDSMFKETSPEEDAEIEAELRALEGKEELEQNGISFLDSSIGAEIETS